MPNGYRLLHMACDDSGLLILCGCNANNEVKNYCEYHREVVCDSCIPLKHKKCKLSSIEQKCSSYSSSVFDELLSRTKSLKDKYERRKLESGGFEQKLKDIKEACQKEIKIFRQELDTFLDNLEQDIITDLDKYEREEHCRIEERTSILTTTSQTLDLEYTLLKDAKKNGRKEIMFASDVQMKRVLRGYEGMLSEIEEDYIKPSLFFERNWRLSELENDVKALGTLKATLSCGNQSDQMKATPGVYNQVAEMEVVNHNVQVPFVAGIRRSDKVLLGGTIQQCSQAYVRSSDDVIVPRISGCVVMPTGDLVLCDRNNHKIKVFDCGFVPKGSVALPNPWDVSVININIVIVSSPENKQLHYVQLFPKMKPGRIIKLDVKCWGVEVSGDEIFVTCYDAGDDGEVRILDRLGKIKTRLDVSVSISSLLRFPDYITVNRASEKIYIADSSTSTITCMTVDGQIIYQCLADDMKGPRGLYCDQGDNLLVCGEVSNSVHKITADGMKYSTLLTSSEGLCQPVSITYRDSDGTIVVGCYADDSVFLYKLGE